MSFRFKGNRIKSEQLDNVRGLIKKGGLAPHANNCKNGK